MLLLGSEQFFTERLLVLDESYWCYRASPTSPAVAPPPLQTNGFITFGSLNSLAKVNDIVIRLWADLLSRTPGSRLAVHVPRATDNPRIIDRFIDNGIPREQLDPLPFRDRDRYLALYNRIDIALDPFPYCGGTTTFDALWMGVPVVTLEGQTPLARAGVSILKNLGLDGLIARTPSQYVQIAKDLALDPPRLADLASSLRQRLSGSVLMDETRYVRNLERAYRHAWESYCAQ